MSNFNDFSSGKSARLWPITLLRVYTGVFFLTHGFGKITNPEFAKGLVRFRQRQSGKLFQLHAAVPRVRCSE